MFQESSHELHTTILISIVHNTLYWISLKTQYNTKTKQGSILIICHCSKWYSTRHYFLFYHRIKSMRMNSTKTYSEKYCGYGISCYLHVTLKILYRTDNFRNVNEITLILLSLASLYKNNNLNLNRAS